LHKVFTWFLLIVCFVFSLGCVYLCFHLPCTFDKWVPILDFYLQGFSSTWLSVWKWWKWINTPGVQIIHPNRRWWCPAAIFRLWAWSWVTHLASSPPTLLLFTTRQSPVTTTITLPQHPP
jgi:hypothetical protein